MRRVRQAVPKDVADMIDDDRSRSVRLWPQAPPDLLTVQRKALSGAKQDCPTDCWSVEALADDVAARQHKDVAVAQSVDQIVPLSQRHGAVDRGGGNAAVTKSERNVFGVRNVTQNTMAVRPPRCFK
jgi:hypothetical protein